MHTSTIHSRVAGSLFPQCEAGYNGCLARTYRAAGCLIARPSHVRPAAVPDSNSTATGAPDQLLQQQQSSLDNNEPVACSRRRRRTRTSSAASQQTPSPDKQDHQKQGQQKQGQQKQRLLRHRVEMHKLFAQQDMQKGQTVVIPADTTAAVLPEGALSDPNEALHPTRRVARPKRSASATSPQQDAQLQQLKSQFEPYAQSLQRIAEQQTVTALQASKQQQQEPSESEMLWHERSLEKQPSRKLRKGTSRLIELFGMQQQRDELSINQTRVSVKRVDSSAADALAKQPSQTKDAAQRLARMLMQKQAARKQQQPNTVDGDQAGAAAEADATDIAKPGRLLSTAVPLSNTRIYVPSPPLSQATSAAERQPLQVLSIRQQEQLRKEARQQAIRRVREQTVRDYQASLDAIKMTWQPSNSSTVVYFPGTPRHLPVAVQQSWNSSSSSTSSSAAVEADGTATEESATTSTSRQLTQEEQQTLQQISMVMRQQLGQPLPDRALVGERSLLLSSLASAAVAERLKRWIGCCGKDYVKQLMTKEPTLLGHEPQVLLNTLEAFNSTLGMPTEQCVSFALKHAVLVGLDKQAMQVRLDGVADACGLDMEQAVKLVTAAPVLLAFHPSNLKERMQALAKLLPEAAPKLPRVLLKSPFLLVRSPRAIARLIQDLADALDLSAWAASRLVAGQPGILRNNFATLQQRLSRLQTLTSASISPRWHDELQALSPQLLARCLACSDSALDRLALLDDIGAARYPSLPKVHQILTMPDVHFQNRLAGLAERKLRKQQEYDIGDSDSEVEALTMQQPKAASDRADRSRSGSSRAKQLLAAAGIGRRNRHSSTTGSTAGDDDPSASAAVALPELLKTRNSSSNSGRKTAAQTHGLHKEEGSGGAEGLLASDNAWRSGLANAFQQVTEDFKRLGAAVGFGDARVGDDDALAAATASSKRRTAVSK